MLTFIGHVLIIIAEHKSCYSKYLFFIDSNEQLTTVQDKCGEIISGTFL